MDIIIVGTSWERAENPRRTNVGAVPCSLKYVIGINADTLWGPHCFECPNIIGRGHSPGKHRQKAGRANRDAFERRICQIVRHVSLGTVSHNPLIGRWIILSTIIANEQFGSGRVSSN